MKFGEKFDTWINLDIHDYNWPVYRSLFLFSFHQQKILKKVEHSWNMIISYEIHLRFCNIRTDFHYPSPISTWKKKSDLLMPHRTKRWVLNQMVGPIMQPSAWTISVVEVLSADLTDAGRALPGTLLEPEAKAHKTLGNRGWVVWTTQTPPSWTTQIFCWFYNFATQNAFFIQSMGSFGRVKFAPFSYITLNLFICAKFVTSCRSLTTREQARSLYPRTPAHTRIVSWKHLSGFKLYNFYVFNSTIRYHQEVLVEFFAVQKMFKQKPWQQKLFALNNSAVWFNIMNQMICQIYEMARSFEIL